MIPNTPAWQIVFEALKPEPDFGRLEGLSADGLDEHELLATCRDHGLLLIVNQALKGQRQHFFSDRGQLHWRTEVASYTLLGLTMHRELQRLLSQSAAADILVVPFKGAILSERLYGDPALRMFADLDLLVPPDQVRKTVELLIGAGYLPMFKPEMLRRWIRPKSQVKHCILQHSSGRWLVEVHWELFDSWRRIGPPAVVVDVAEWDALEMLIYLCNHGAEHWWIKLKWVVDVDRCVRSVQNLDWHVLFARARQRGCARIVRLALYLARQTCSLELPEWVDAEIRADSKVDILARRVACFWSQQPTVQPSLSWKFRYLLACRERLSDRIGMIISYPLSRSLPFEL